jgi:hypothetical protein
LDATVALNRSMNRANSKKSVNILIYMEKCKNVPISGTVRLTGLVNLARQILPVSETWR